MTADLTSEAGRWEALRRRDPQADGQFVYGVVTTGIYCRPSCPSRMPKRENVRFFDRWQLAEAAGFRPCRRCMPRAAEPPHEACDAVAAACRLIETAEQMPTLQQLAAAVGMSTSHFHRLFKSMVGITPKQYALEKRLHRVRHALQEEATVTAAIYEAGYESGSRFYASATKALGMKPSEYQRGGEGLMIRYAIAQCYLGWVLIAMTERGICRIDLGDAPDALRARLRANFPAAHLQEDDADLAAIVAQTLAFLETPQQGLALPLDIQGTAFQRRVWAALQAIPAGSTASYGELAAQIGNPKAARAVARACACNRIAVAIPCHRAVRGDGGLGGYRWGIARKRTLLEREAGAALAPSQHERDVHAAGNGAADREEGPREGAHGRTTP